MSPCCACRIEQQSRRVFHHKASQHSVHPNPGRTPGLSWWESARFRDICHTEQQLELAKLILLFFKLTYCLSYCLPILAEITIQPGPRQCVCFQTCYSL